MSKSVTVEEHYLVTLNAQLN